jgi:outer membrane protein assembly factor BamE (lipoprotein component of BamABCDE complex)
MGPIARAARRVRCQCLGGLCFFLGTLRNPRQNSAPDRAAPTNCLTLSVLVLAWALAGCISSGNESIADATNATVASQLLKGKTTQADVRRIYGDPIKTSFSANGFETWEYEFTRLQSKPTNFIPYVNLVHSGAEGDKKSLVIFFDKQKVLQDFTMSTSRIDMSRGIITR